MRTPELKKSLLKSQEINHLLALFVARKGMANECSAWLREQKDVTRMRQDVETVLKYGAEKKFEAESDLFAMKVRCVDAPNREKS